MQWIMCTFGRLKSPIPPAYYLFDLGEAYRMTGQYEGASATFEKALRRNRDYLYANVS